jgi:hypothetical protein
MKKCSINGCDNKQKTKNYCAKHYIRLLKYGDPNVCKRVHRCTGICYVKDCPEKCITKGLCNKHYSKLRKYGDPNVSKKGKKGQGSVTYFGYKEININGSRILEHRAIYEKHLGRKLLKYENIHHINGNKLDNRLENLELWITKQPRGQRIEDKIKYAKEILSQYTTDLDDEYHGM